MKHIKRILLLFLCLCICLIGNPVFAEEQDEFEPYEDENYEEENDKIELEEYENSIKKDYESEFFNNSDVAASDDDLGGNWIQYKGDRTGMSDSEIVYRNYYEYWKKKAGSDEVVLDTARIGYSKYLGNGRFEGVTYYWQTMGRAYRYCYSMALAYNMDRADNEFYHNEEVTAIIIAVVRNLIDNFDKLEKGKWVNDWWNVTIGHPLNLEPFVVICRDFLPKDMLRYVLDTFFYGTDEVSEGFLEGTNTTWYAMEMIHKGCILGDDALIEKNVKLCADIASVQSQRNIIPRSGYASVNGPQGIMPDGTFHQHAAMYQPMYGNNCIQDTTQLIMMTYGTKFEPKEIYDDFLSYLLDGAVTMYRGPIYDILLAGRASSQYSPKSKNPNANQTYVALKIFEKVLPERAEEFETYARSLLPAEDENRIYPVLTRFYPRSNYMAHHRKNYSLSCMMNTERTIAMEFSPFQARQSWHCNFGQINLVKDEDIIVWETQPLFDWKILPGVTAPYSLYKSNEGVRLQRDAFGGGLSNDRYGLAAMRLSNLDAVSAKKAVFYFDDEVVLLGCDISAQNGAPINTGVDQRHLCGSVSVDGKEIGKGEHDLKDVTYVFHNNIGYLFPEKENISLRVQLRSGDFRDYTDKLESKQVVRGEMFQLWVPHGLNPAKDKYNFIIIPETTEKKMVEYAKSNPIKTISNNSGLQAVYHSDLKIGEAVFYNRGEVEFSDKLTVCVDSPCFLMVIEKDGALEVCVADPYSSQTTVNVEITYGGKKLTETFKLPGIDKNLYNMGGTTVTKTIELR